MQSEKSSKNSSLMTKEIEKKRGLALGMSLNYENSLSFLRTKWKNGGWYEKQQAKKEAQKIKEKYNRTVGQYKILCKKGSTEWQKNVIDNIF